jgi:hypothetical protein
LVIHASVDRATQCRHMNARPAPVPLLNVAYWRGTPPSLQLPLAMAAGLFGSARTARMIFDASTPFRLPEGERDTYRQLLAQPELAVEVASRVPADRQLLRLARASGAVIVSRDRFREHRARYRRLIDDPARVLAGHVSANTLLLPGLALTIPLVTCSEALRLLHAHGETT